MRPLPLPNKAIPLLRSGDQLLFGNRPDNLARVVVLGAGVLKNSVRIRFHDNYATDVPTGNSFYRAGAEAHAAAGDLWHDYIPGWSPRSTG